MNAMELLPLFLKLAGRRVLLVGGGTVATAKLAALIRAGAEVVVVAPRVTREIERSGVAIARRAFRSEDLDGMWLVISAAVPEVNRGVARAAESRRIFVNAVDDPEHATAYAAANVRRGGVTIAVSTGGHAPGLAALVRTGLDLILPDDLACWLGQATRLRGRWLRERTPIADRRPLLLQALNAHYGHLPEGAKSSASALEDSWW